MKKVFYSVLAYSLIGLFSIAYAVEARLPKGEKDVKVHGGATAGTYSFLSVIELVNKYLWYSVGFFCFLFMVYNGYKLITSGGDSKEASKATKSLIGGFIGIIVCMLANAIVNLVIGIFL